MTVLHNEPYHIYPDRTQLEGYCYENGTLSGKVIASNEQCLVLNLNEDSITKLTPKPIENLLFECKGFTRRLRFYLNPNDRFLDEEDYSQCIPSENKQKINELSAQNSAIWKKLLKIATLRIQNIKYYTRNRCNWMSKLRAFDNRTK